MGKVSFIVWGKVTAGNELTLVVSNPYPGKSMKVNEVCVAFDDTAIFTVTAKAFVGLKQVAPTSGEFVATGTPREVCVDTDVMLEPTQLLKLLVTNSDTSDHYAMLKVQGEVGD